jgi:hypothetical protein
MHVWDEPGLSGPSGSSLATKHTRQTEQTKYTRQAGTAPHLLLGVPRQPAEEVWETFSVGTVLHGGVDLVE